MNIYWKKAPLFRLVIPLIAGILIGIYGNLSNRTYVVPLLFFVVLHGLLLVFSKFRPSLRNEIIYGILTSLTFTFAGINLVIFNTSKNFSSHYENFDINDKGEYRIVVQEIPKEKTNSIQVIGQINSLKPGSQTDWITATGNVLLYFAKDSNSHQILQGDELYIATQLTPIASPRNPGQFNYKQYLSFNQIYEQGFVDHLNWTTISHGGFSVVGFASNIRDKLLKILKENGLEGEELAVASALILGYKDDLDPELKHSYSSAGATHVLAVSGLHVGIIFLTISFLLGLIDKSEKMTFIRLFVALFTLWFYATLTGLSPSVVRAATMFSFVAVGKAFDRNSNIYNTLAGSALVLLCYNPYLIMEVGFQLSYLAVLGIVYFQKIIYRQFYIKNRIGDYVWKITSVSIAAQLTTFPLGLLYFHQFPTYFFISNLVVIPGAIIIIGLGLAVFTFFWVPTVAGLFATILYGVIFAMNWVVKAIDQLPISLVEGISISILECWMIYFIILSVVAAKESKKIKYFQYGLILSILMFCIDIIEDINISKTREIVFYDIKGEPCINFIDQGENYFISSDQLFKNESSLLFNVKHHWFDLDLIDPIHFNLEQNIQQPKLMSENGYYQFQDKMIYHLSKKTTIPNLGSIDYLYITSAEYIPLHEILTHITPANLILGNSAHWNYQKEIVSMDLEINFHNIRSDGAYVKSF